MSVICFVTYEIHPTTRGGCGVLLHHAARSLLERGHEIVFVIDAPPDAIAQFRDIDRLALPRPEACHVVAVADEAVDAGLDRIDNLSLFHRQSLRFDRAVQRAIDRHSPDVIEFFEYCGPGYAHLVRRLFSRERSNDTPVLATRLHGPIELIDRMSAVRNFDMQRHQLHAIERAALHLAETILTPTRQFFAAACAPVYGLPPEAAIESIPPKGAGFDTPRARDTNERGAAEPARIVFLGRMFQFKGVDQLVHAGVELLRRRPSLDVTFELIGPDGHESPLGESYTAYLKTLIPPEHADRFVFTGHLSHAQIAEHLANATLAVFPNRFESFCYALHEVYDAGVPLIVNDLPAFRDFFEHERNCLLYRGRTDELLAAIERMLDDPALRSRLRRPYAVAETPLGDFYDRPMRRRPLAAGSMRKPRSLVLVAAPDGLETARPTLEALRAMSRPPERTLVLGPADPSAARFWYRGRSWLLTDTDGSPVEPSSVRTFNAIAVLWAGDVPAREWLESCAAALANRERLAFAGTWLGRGDRVDCLPIDLAPELYPFRDGARPSRVLVRTEPDRLLIDLFDNSLGPLGEVGLVWSAIAARGPGAVLPEPLIQAAATPDVAVEPDLLRSLVFRYGGPFESRFPLAAALLAAPQHTPAPPPAPPASSPVSSPVSGPAPGTEPTLEHKVAMADQLGGSLLGRMAARKIVRRILGKAPPRH